jgi:hypothetical protein
MLLEALDPQKYPWRTIYKALLVLHTIVLYGSEIAIDKVVQNSRLVLNLRNYNSALVAKTSFIRPSGGTDYGAPVRMQAQQLLSIIETDGGIRKARADARAGSQSLVPMGETLLDLGPAEPPKLTFGMGVEKSIGAGYDLAAGPGMYEGRPERYFDDVRDIRRPHATGDHQFTREVCMQSFRLWI